MSTQKKIVGSRWRFASDHWSVNECSGQTCEVVELDAGQWPYVVAFVDGTQVTAVDRELLPIGGAA